MPENWKTYKLGDITEIVMGQSPKGETTNNLGEGIPLLNGPTEFRYSYPTPTQFTIDPKKISRIGDLLFCVRGSTTGKMNFSDQQYAIGRGIGAFRGKNEFSTKHIKYLIDFYLDRMLAMCTGSTFPNLSRSDLENFNVKSCSPKESNAIASILSALDDKIELNLQMNNTLEEMAMALYKHWFVDFGPFQHEKFIASELGEIPKGWEVLSLSDVTSKITDGAHHSPKSVEEGKPMASVKDMDHWGFNIETCRKISEEDYIKLTNQGCRPLKNDVVIAKDGSYLKHAFVIEKDLDIVLLSSIAILKPNGKLNPHLLNLNLKLDSVKTRMKAIVSGAAIQRIVLKEFRKFLIIVPPKHIQDSALQSIENLMEQCWSNNSENQTLTKLRDTLLPKLISGEVRVKEAEKILTQAL